MSDTRTPRDRLARQSGPATVALVVGSTLLATLLAPAFDWVGGALSDLGVTPETAWLFNGTLALGALLVVPFVWWLWTAATSVLERLRAVTFLLATTAMGAVGLFPSGDPLHFPVAATFFLAAAVTLVLDGVANLDVSGAATVLGGVSIFAVFPVWGALPFGSGIAIPEMLGILVFSAWVFGVALEG